MMRGQADDYAKIGAKYRFALDFLQKVETAVDEDEDDNLTEYYTIHPNLELET